MNGSQLATKRILIGVLALLCLALAAGLWLFTEKPEQNGLLAALTRVGIVMAALWLALPARGESVAWEKAVPVLVGGIILAALTRRAFAYALPAAIIAALALAFLRPRSKRR